MADTGDTTRRYGHPGAGRRETRPYPKGRQVEPAARAEIAALLAGRPMRRDLLIEHLHAIQDRFGHLAARHLAALAEAMHLSQVEVFEVATFYAHFDIVLESEAPPPPVTVRVCDSVSCALAGADHLADELARALGAAVRVQRVACIGRCETAPAVSVGQNAFGPATVARVEAALRARETAAVAPAAPSVSAAATSGGYAMLKALKDGRMAREAAIQALSDANLRGLGGAGFPTGRKWSLVRQQPKPRLMAVNADEGEPGTFKDRHYLETDPHAVLEGMLIAAWCVEADSVFVYLRDEYAAIRALLARLMDELAATGLADFTRLELRRGAGAYVCGEESAMIESIEGKRGLPRHRPPYVAERGLFGRPTLVNNVETLYWVPAILAKGAGWFASHGVNGGRGLRSYSVSGRVRSPGVKLAPAGITARRLIEEFCGGMAEGHRLAAYLPGGASGGLLPAALADEPLEFGALRAHGAFVGSHAVVVLSDRDDLAGVALNLMRFFAHESCGQCTPCRVGTEKAVALMRRARWDTGLMDELAKTMADASICGLGQAAANPLVSLLRFFPEAFRRA